MFYLYLCSPDNSSRKPSEKQKRILSFFDFKALTTLDEGNTIYYYDRQ